MTFKGMLKFKLSILALAAAGFSAYAQVTLSNGTDVTWADFAKAINDPTTISVTAPDKSALTAAETAYNDAKAAAATALTTYNNAETNLATWEKALYCNQQLLRSLHQIHHQSGQARQAPQDRQDAPLARGCLHCSKGVPIRLG